MTAAAIANDKLDVPTAATPRKVAAARVATVPAAEPAPKQPRVPLARRLEPFLKAVIPPVLGVALLIGVWYLATLKSTSLPGPDKVWI
jgi:nitrate/nitrite transport system permease protein